MMGDLLGARSLLIGYRVPLRATFPSVVPGTSGSSTGVFVNPNLPGAALSFGPTPNGTTRTVVAPFSATDLRYFQPTNAGGVTIDRPFAQAALQTLLSQGPLTADQTRQLDKLSPADRASLMANRGTVNKTVTQATGGLGIPNPTVSNVDAQLVANALTYSAILSGQTVVPLPGSSSSVGRVKMSEDNSPIPRDRVIFNYDYFDNVPLTPNGIGVNRFQAGFEKTFLDGRWSAEVRLPFASTLAAQYTDGMEMRDVQLGNLRLALKRLWTQNDVFNVSTGLGVTLPTAPDQVVNSQQGGELYRFHNRSVTVEPFVAVLFTPNERLFSQVWGAVNFDTSGGQLTYNRNVFGGSGTTSIVDLPILALDYQVGYWLVRDDFRTLRGLAPFLELHYNYTIAQSRLASAVDDQASGLGLSIAGVGNSEFNLTTGVAMQLGDHVNLSVGASLPLLSRPDRTFDVQWGLRLNYLYGRSARPSRAGLAPSING